MTARRGGGWRAFVAATIVATGIAVVWGLVCGWIGSMGESFMRDQRKVTEGILVAVDGTPVISVASNQLNGQLTLSRRTLDNKDWPVDYEHWLGRGYLAPREYGPKVIDIPLRWNYGRRIGGMVDGKRPPTNWYLIRDAEPKGQCYLGGYDAISKLPIGYIGRNGFRAAELAADQKFDLPTYQHLQQCVATAQSFDYWQIIPNYYADLVHNDPPGWLVYLADREGLWKVDLRERTARVVMESAGVQSVSTTRVLQSTVEKAPPQGAVQERRSTPFRLASTEATGTLVQIRVPQAYSLIQAAPSEEGEDKKPKYASAVAVRTEDKIVFIDGAELKKEFNLPQKLPNKAISAFWIAPEQLLLQWETGHWSGGPIHQLAWIKPDGQIEREAEVKLAGWVPESPSKRSWYMAPTVPVPIAWLVGMFFVSPLVIVQNWGAENFADGLRQSLNIGWVPMVLVLIVAVVLAWLTFYLQRKYHGRASAAWAAFVLLLGVPGFLAYLIERRRPKLEECPECDAVVPRDRDACAACETPFRGAGARGGGDIRLV